VINLTRQASSQNAGLCQREVVAQLLSGPGRGQQRSGPAPVA